MRRVGPCLPLVPILALFLACAGADRPAPEARAPAGLPPGERPALVVMLVVDQLAQPLLERYDDHYSGGLRRLLDEGRVYVRATHDHAGTKTAPGHATLATGVHPSLHGIVANEWYERVGDHWVEVSNVGDSTVQIVDHPELPGVSPRQLMRSGLAEWMLAADPRSQVASVSAKDRGAVLPAGRVPGQVYWFESAIGRFVTSTFYRQDAPEWVDRFHDTVMADYRTDTLWASTVPAVAVGSSDPDSAAFEGDDASPYFPHRFGGEGERTEFWEWFEHTPMLDAATLDFAETMVVALELGRDSVPDFLNVSLSQTDRVGHDFGAHSREQLDNLLRLDRGLGRFFSFLDSIVGPGRWAVALSADHGALMAGEDLRGVGGARARRWTAVERATLDSLLALGERAADDPGNPARLAEGLERLDFVADAWTREELDGGAAADSFAVLAGRSLYPGRYPDAFSRLGVEVRFVPGFLQRGLGTGHGTAYWYDRHVPIVFMGPGIPAGRDAERVATVDFAPTLAELLEVPYPDDLDGAPLTGVVRESFPSAGRQALDPRGEPIP